MSSPTAYELAAWNDLQRHKGRPLTRVVRGVGSRVAQGAESLAARATEALETHPKARRFVDTGREATSRGSERLARTAGRVREGIPESVASWAGEAFGAAQRTVGRIARTGLSPDQVIRQHQKHGHSVSKLFELRSLDLEQVDAVRGRGANMSYPALAAASGMSAGFVISGSEFAVPATAGAAAAPSIGAIASAVTLDAAAVLALASRSVGHVALTYGYDPEEPGERLFVMSVINSGTALSAGAKTAALADISRLTQALYRGQTWAILDKSVVSQVAKRFATAFKVRVTKQSLGKFVPLAGIALGGVFNWATLEGIVDAADVAYRRRFLLEKYPQLESVDTDIHPGLAADEADDETISIVDEIRSSGGPDLGQDGLDSSSNEDLTD